MRHVIDIAAQAIEALAVVGRIDGPLKFRLVLPPVMAVIFAVRDGLKDSREGGGPYFWAIFTEQARRSALIREGWQAVTKVFVFAVLMDLIYQYLISSLVVSRGRVVYRFHVGGCSLSFDSTPGQPYRVVLFTLKIHDPYAISRLPTGLTASLGDAK